MPLIPAIFPLKRSIAEALRPIRIPPIKEAAGVKVSMSLPPNSLYVS
jgi:hypothetical protein